MATIDDVIHGEAGRGAGATTWERPWAGEILNDPAAVTGDLYVRIPGIDSDKRFGPCRWDPVPTTEGKFLIPGGGENCVVAFDDDHLPWVQGWTPYSGSVSLGGVVIPEAFKYPKTVTSLPVAPVDGEEINFLADATNGIVWNLKYRAASASAFKWEFKGGPALDSGLSGSIETAAGNGVAEAVEMTGGPTITPPFAGDYDVTMSAFMQSKSVTGTNMEVFLVRNKEGPVRVQMLVFVATAQFAGAFLQRTVRTTLEAGKTYQMYVGDNAKSLASYTTGRTLLVPVRVG